MGAPDEHVWDRELRGGEYEAAADDGGVRRRRDVAPGADGGGPHERGEPLLLSPECGQADYSGGHLEREGNRGAVNPIDMTILVTRSECRNFLSHCIQCTVQQTNELSFWSLFLK